MQNSILIQEFCQVFEFYQAFNYYTIIFHDRWNYNLLNVKFIEINFKFEQNCAILEKKIVDSRSRSLNKVKLTRYVIFYNDDDNKNDVNNILSIVYQIDNMF